MKKSIKIILILTFSLVVLLFVRPQNVVYEAKITGKVMDENNKLISNATVYRIEKEFYIDEKIGSNESKEIRTDSIKTDKNGNFNFSQKSRIDWFHTPLDLPIAFCYANFEVDKNGFQLYKTTFDEYEQYRKENCYACENIEFKPIIILKQTK